MEKEVEVKKVAPSGLTFEQYQEDRKRRSNVRLGLILVTTFCVMALCLFVPLGVWLVRGAMGLW